MGLMRRAGSFDGGAMEARAKGDAAGRSRRVASDKRSKLRVEPEELARKLVKEMEARKISRQPRDMVSGRYIVYLCPEDHERLSPRQEEITAKLGRHLSKYVQAKKYQRPEDISVSLTVDPDLQLGQFGIFAQPPQQRRSTASPAPQREAAPASASQAAAAERKVPERSRPARGRTEVIPSAEAADLGLARNTIVLRAGNRVREFSRGQVIIGRARDVDFRVQDPNVSRRHAAIYWVDGDLMVEDLGSTNGTMVNGYPVTSSVLGPDDVVVVGECRITVGTNQAS